MSDTVEMMAEEFKIAYPLTYDAIYNKGRADVIDELLHTMPLDGSQISFLKELKEQDII